MEFLKAHRGQIHKEDILNVLSKTKQSAHTKMVKLLEWSPTSHKYTNHSLHIPFGEDLQNSQMSCAINEKISNEKNHFITISENEEIAQKVPPLVDLKEKNDGTVTAHHQTEGITQDDQADNFQVDEKFRPRRSYSCPPKRVKLVGFYQT